MPVIEPYDPSWAAAGRKACVELEAVLPGVEHVGSTAVPGLAAKPIIDLMAPVDDLAGVDAEALAAVGYRPGPTWVAPRLLFVRDRGGRRTHHLHLVLASTWPDRSQRLLRDYLRSRPEAVARYSALKQQLLHLDGDEYTAAKTALIQELVDAARDERGLPHVPVWEE